MSLIRLTEALEEDGCIRSAEAELSEQLLPEILSVAAAEAFSQGAEKNDIARAAEMLVNIRDERKRESFVSGIIERAEYYLQEKDEAPGCYRAIREFDERMLKEDPLFYRKRGGADIGLSDMYKEIAEALTKIMLEG
jgi:hypothetical protein